MVCRNLIILIGGLLEKGPFPFCMVGWVPVVEQPPSRIAGYTAQLFSWRFSFLLLSVLWAFMAVYAALRGVESCPTNGNEGSDQEGAAAQRR